MFFRGFSGGCFEVRCGVGAGDVASLQGKTMKTLHGHGHDAALNRLAKKGCYFYAGCYFSSGCENHIS